MSSHDSGGAMDALFEGDEVREVLREGFYAGAPPARPPAKRAKPKRAKAKPKHYEIICISMYKDDLSRLDDEVARLKAAGHTKISRSGLIRFALDQMDTAKLPKAY